MAKKVVMAIHYLNFCEQVEFEGSNREKADVMQLAKGQVFAKRIKVGSVFDDETGEWSGLLEDLVGVAEQKDAGFAAAWNPVPPVDEQVVKAQEELDKKLEAEREAKRLEVEAEKKAETEKKEFVMP